MGQQFDNGNTSTKLVVAVMGSYIFVGPVSKGIVKISVSIIAHLVCEPPFSTMSSRTSYLFLHSFSNTLVQRQQQQSTKILARTFGTSLTISGV